MKYTYTQVYISTHTGLHKYTYRFTWGIYIGLHTIYMKYTQIHYTGLHEAHTYIHKLSLTCKAIKMLANAWP